MDKGTRIFVAKHVFGQTEGIDFGTFKTHKWRMREDDSTIVDDYAYSSDMHNGPICERCHFYYCVHCDSADEKEATPCEVWPMDYSEPALLVTLIQRLTERGFKIAIDAAHEFYKVGISGGQLPASKHGSGTTLKETLERALIKTAQALEKVVK
jgi:hypothetical protein